MIGFSGLKLAVGSLPMVGITSAAVATLLSAVESTTGTPGLGDRFDITDLTAFGLLALSFIAVLGWVLKQLPKEIQRVVDELREVRRAVLHNQISVEHLSLQLGIHDAHARGIDPGAKLDDEALDRAANSFALWRGNQERLLRELEALRGPGMRR